MPYVTGGFAWGQNPRQDQRRRRQCRRRSATGNPCRLDRGAGLEFAVERQLERQARIRLHRSRAPDLRPERRSDCRASMSIPTPPVKFGLNYRFRRYAAWAGPAPVNDIPRSPESDDWNVHAQTTCLRARLSGFRAPYSGTNSLPGAGQLQRDLDRDCLPRRAAVGRRRVLFQSGTGAGFWHQRHAGTRRLSNGEAQKAARRFRNFARNATSSARPSALAANRKTSRTAPISSPASATSTASP